MTYCNGSNIYIVIIHKIKDLTNPMQAHPLGVGDAGVTCWGGGRICHKKGGNKRGLARLRRSTALFPVWWVGGGLTLSAAGN